MIKVSFKNPYLVLVLAIVVVVISGVLIPRMPVDILPQFKKSAMQILTLYPGMPAEVVEKDITSRLERWTGQSPGTLPPMVQPFDPTDSKPLMLLTVSSDVKSGKELYDVAYYNLRQMLSGVKGIIALAAYGGTLRRIYIFVDPAIRSSGNITN